jgi:hypothetical protein
LKKKKRFELGVFDFVAAPMGVAITAKQASGASRAAILLGRKELARPCKGKHKQTPM